MFPFPPVFQYVFNWIFWYLFFIDVLMVVKQSQWFYWCQKRLKKCFNGFLFSYFFGKPILHSILILFSRFSTKYLLVNVFSIKHGVWCKPKLMSIYWHVHFLSCHVLNTADSYIICVILSIFREENIAYLQLTLADH